MCNKNDLYTCSISLGAFTYETSIRSTNYVHCVRRTVYYAQIYSIVDVVSMNWIWVFFFSSRSMSDFCNSRTCKQRDKGIFFDVNYSYICNTYSLHECSPFFHTFCFGCLYKVIERYCIMLYYTNTMCKKWKKQLNG